jgi:hypothetical protein
VDSTPQDLRTVWHDCCGGRISLTAATILTYLGVLTIRRAGQEFFEAFLPDTPQDAPRRWEAVFSAMVDPGVELVPENVQLVVEKARNLKEDHTKSPERDEVEANYEALSKSHRADP